jgi:hypothetical protein
MKPNFVLPISQSHQVSWKTGGMNMSQVEKPISDFGILAFQPTFRIPQFHWGVFKSFDLERSFCYDSVNFSIGQIPAKKKFD